MGGRGSKSSRGTAVGSTDVRLDETPSPVFGTVTRAVAEVGGVEAGYVRAGFKNGQFQVLDSSVKPEFQRQGIATKLYQRTASYAESRGQKLMSDKTVSPAATAVWQGFVKQGKARQLPDGRYQML